MNIFELWHVSYVFVVQSLKIDLHIKSMITWVDKHGAIKLYNVFLIQLYIP